MKIARLKEIIREEVKKAVSENAPAEEKETEEKETKEKEETSTKPRKRRQVGNPTIPKESPTPTKASTSLEETEKELVNKITQRFLKHKK